MDMYSYVCIKNTRTIFSETHRKYKYIFKILNEFFAQANVLIKSQIM